MDKKIEKFQKMLEESDFIVFFGGAGVSTESGIPDFRSKNGIYSAMSEYGYRPEIILSRSFFDSNKEIFFQYYKKNLLLPNANPNYAHKALAKLEEQGKLKAVVTQNIDNLHQKAGSKIVLELHGSLYKNYCTKCKKQFGLEYVIQSEGVTLCDVCGSVVRPDIVLYEENLNHQTLQKTVEYIAKADMLIVGGTSLVVYPAASLIQYYKGNKLVLINQSSTSYDSQADLIISEKIGEVFSKVISL